MSGDAMPTRKITIDEADLARLQADVWSNEFAPVTLEIDGRKIEAKLAFRGGHTRNYPKKSYEIRFGNSQILHWNAEFDDPSMIRNALSFHFFNAIGVPSPRTRPIWLEWNGHPHGVYLEIESVDAAFFRRRGLQARSLVYAVNDKANFSLGDADTESLQHAIHDGYRVMQGDDATLKRLSRFVTNINQLRGRQLRTYMDKRLDISLYLRWLAGAVLTGNYDGFDQNYALYEHLPSGKYRIIPWDYEGTWGRNCYGRLCGSDLVDVKGYNTLTRKLLAYKKHRVAYRRLLNKLLATAFTLEAIQPVIERMYERLRPAVRDDFTRKWPFRSFEEEPLLIRGYIEERRAIVIAELKRWKY